MSFTILSFRHTLHHPWVSPYEYDSVRKHCSLLHYFAAGKLRSWGHLGIHVKKKFSFALANPDEWIIRGNQKIHLGKSPKVDSCKFRKLEKFAISTCPVSLLVRSSLFKMYLVSSNCVLVSSRPASLLLRCRECPRLRI